MEYHKIETLYERGPDFKVNPDKLKNSVYGLIKEWEFTEKVDGTNIRLEWDGSKLRFGGRTDNAQIPGDLLNTLHETVTGEQFAAIFQGTPATVFGEGYGPGIQKGGALAKTKSFIVFDVLVDGQWWLSYSNSKDVADKLGLSFVPFIGTMTLADATSLVAKGFESALGDHPPAEGLVGRPLETLFDKKMARLIIKLKTRDF